MLLWYKKYTIGKGIIVSDSGTIATNVYAIGTKTNDVCTLKNNTTESSSSTNNFKSTRIYVYK